MQKNNITRRRIAAVSAVLATLALTQSTAIAANDPTTGEITSILDGLTAHPQSVTEGIERTTYSSATSPLVVRVAVIDPDMGAVTLGSTFGAAVGVKEKTTEMLATVEAAGHGAPYVGVNGSFSVAAKDEGPKDPQTGKTPIIHEERSIPMVASVQDDVVQGASCMEGQRAVVLQHGRPHITRITTSIKITSDKKTPGTTDDVTRHVDGLNRYPGWIPYCQQDSGDTEIPYTTDADGNKTSYDQNGRALTTGPYFQDYSEIVVFTSAYGQKTPPRDHTPFVAADDGDGVEVALDKNDYVTEVRTTRGGMDIPPGGKVLTGIGVTQADGGAKWLTENAKVGTKITYTESVKDIGFTKETTDDEDIPLNKAYPSVDVINGGQALMLNGEIVAKAGSTETAPRTAIGADGWGRTLLVTVTAKAQDRLGVPVYDLAKVMEDLGAVDALNLDGGGSTTFVADGEVQNITSDGKDAERPVYDAVYSGHGGYTLPAIGN